MTTSRPSLVRFSLRTLLVLMMLLCIALATTVSASPRVELAMKWISAIAPAVAILLAAATTGGRRAFWIGFAAFGIWATPLMSINSDFGGFYSKFQSTFHAQVGGQIVKLHQTEAYAETHRQFIDRAQIGPDGSVEVVKARAPWLWTDCVNAGNHYVAEIARKIAWYNLHWLAAAAGGLATAILFKWRESRRPNQPAVSGGSALAEASLTRPTLAGETPAPR